MPMTWSYIAGYLDADGCVNHSKTARGSYTNAITWLSSEKISLIAMQEFMGLGSISQRNPRGISKKIQYILSISNKVDILKAIAELESFMVIKGSKLQKMKLYLIDNVDESRMDNFGKAVA